MIHNRNELIHFGVNAFVLGLVIYLGFQILDAYNGEFDEPYEFRPPVLGNGAFLTGVNEELGLSFDVSLNHKIVFNTTSFSAQNPILVEALVYPSQKFEDTMPEKWESLPEYMGIVFPNTIRPIPTITPAMVLIELKRDDVARHYYGSEVIIYQFEGEQSYFFMLPDEMIYYFSENEGIGLSQEYVENKLKDKPTFYVGGADQTINLKQNHIFLALTLVFITFALIESRTHIISGFLYIFGEKKEQHK